MFQLKACQGRFKTLFTFKLDPDFGSARAPSIGWSVVRIFHTYPLLYFKHRGDIMYFIAIAWLAQNARDGVLRKLRMGKCWGLIQCCEAFLIELDDRCCFKNLLLWHNCSKFLPQTFFTKLSEHIFPLSLSLSLSKKPQFWTKTETNLLDCCWNVSSIGSYNRHIRELSPTTCQMDWIQMYKRGLP